MSLKYKKESPYERLYRPVKRWNDNIFGETILLTNMEQKLDILSKNFIINDKEEALNKESVSKRRVDVKHKNLLDFLDYSMAEKSGWCSNQWIIKWFFPFQNHSLRKEMDIRIRTDNFFIDDELTAIIYEQVEQHAYLANLSHIIQDINPETLFLKRDKNSVITVQADEYKDMDYYTSQLNNYAHGLPLYVAPSVYKALCTKKKGMGKYNISK